MVEVIPPPTFTKKKRKSTKAQLAGLAYERKIVKSLRNLYPDCQLFHGMWLAYDGKICQPDIVLIKDNQVLTIEVKLTYNEEGNEKVQLLYGPLLRKLYPNHQHRTSLIFKNLPRESKLLLLRSISTLWASSGHSIIQSITGV